MNRTRYFVSSLAVLLSACGGSGSSAPAPNLPPPVNTTNLVITADNAKPAARVAYGATMQSAETGDLVGGSGIAATPNGGFQKPGAPGVFPGLIANALQKPPVTETIGCGPTGEDGTQTITYDFQVLGTLTTGDTIVIEAMDCDEGDGAILNGRMEMTVTAFSGDLLVSGLYLLDMNVVLVDFEVATAADTILSNGDSLVSIDTRSNPMIFMSISGMTMATVTNTTTEIVTDFETSQSVDAGVQPDSPYTLQASGTVDSTQLDGLITYETPVTFQGAGAAYPFAGELLITGADGATIRLIATGGNNVTIEIDTDGDEVIDSSEDTTWDDIAPPI